MASCGRTAVSGVPTYSLQDFVHLVDLPSTVAITAGTYTSNIRISRGDIILVRSHLPSTLTLSYHNVDSGGKNATVISVDSNVKFMVLPPKPKMQDGQYKKIVYETVTDLIKDCPTYFQANMDYDDPYLPGFSVKSGDKFRFMRIIRDYKDDRVRLECTDNDGNLVRLSADCKGMFSIVADRHGYTVKELLNQARVARRLKLSHENIQLKPVSLDIQSSPANGRTCSVETVDSDKTSESKPPSTIPELPLTFKGVIHLHKPPEVIEVSPWGDLDVRWKIPLDTELHVRLFSQTDYEEPAAEDKIVSYQFGKFVEKYECEFPVLATLLSNGHIHPDLRNYLKNVSDIIVHNAKQTDKLLCLDHRDKHFLIDGKLKATFLEDPRTFQTIEEMLECPVGSYFKVLQDLYTDHPNPVCLKCGDLIVLTSQQSGTIKKRWRKSKLGPIDVAHCQRIGDNREITKLILPLDLEIQLEELLDFRNQLPITMEQILSLQVPLPARSVSVINTPGEEPLPVPRTFKIVSIVSEEIITLSPLRYAESSSISPVLQTCIEVPSRHSFFVAYGRRLEFPNGYFVFPKPTDSIVVRVEKIRIHVAQRLESAHSNAYEAIDYGEVHTGVTERSVDPNSKMPTQVCAPSAMRPCRSEGALSEITLRKKAPKPSPIHRLSKVLSSMRKKKTRPTQKPECLTQLSDKDNRVTVNEYHSPPKSPGAISVQEEDPYEQINFQLGSSIAAEQQPIAAIDSRQRGFPRTTSV